MASASDAESVDHGPPYDEARDNANLDWVDGSDYESDYESEDSGGVGDSLDRGTEKEDGVCRGVSGAGTCGARMFDDNFVHVAPKYYDWKEIFPFLETILENEAVIQSELRNFMQERWCPWPEEKLYYAPDQNGDWKVIPLMHTFPAFCESKKTVIESNGKLCPKTMELMSAIPGIRTVLFSRLGPETRLSCHQGWCDLANYVLRCHLPLIVPKKPNSCGMWVEREVRYHKPKEILVFDDSKFHKAFNASNEERIILIFDIVRPKSIPKGLATGGHTEQLDSFIEAYKQSIGAL